MREWCECVVAPRLGDPDRRHADLFALSHELDVGRRRHDGADPHLHTIDSRPSAPTLTEQMGTEQMRTEQMGTEQMGTEKRRTEDR